NDARAVNNLGQMVVTGTDGHSYLLSPPITPAITSLSPSSVAIGGPAFTLTITGSKFLAGASVKWNGTALTVTSLSPTQLTATVPASLITTGQVAVVTVTDPPPSTVV